MKTFKINKALMLTAFAGLALASCSSDDATSGDGNVPGNLSSYSFNLQQTAKVQCSSNDYVLGQREEWYQKVQDFYNKSDDQLQTQCPAYYKFKKYCPENIYNFDASEKAYVMEYLKNHPNEGSTEFNHYNYYIQNVGGSYASYTTSADQNGATSSVTGSNQMNYVEIKDQNGNWLRINDYNANYGPVALVLNKKITGARFHDSWGNNTWEDNYRFYEIEYNGKKGLYLCFDYATRKTDAGIAECCSDGVYNDWVIKISPACDADDPAVTPDPNPDPNPDPTPTPGPDDQPTVVVKNGEVEVNLTAQDHKDEEASKLSIHVRDTVNFKVFIPVPADSYCAADDMYIVEKHYDKMSYNELATTLTREIDGQEITLTVTYAAEGIYIESKGINAKALEYCRNVYGDGITFEIWNYYNIAKLNREELIKLLNQSTITFTDNQPKDYKNTKVDDNVDAAGNKLDCTVTKQ